MTGRARGTSRVISGTLAGLGLHVALGCSRPAEDRRAVAPRPGASTLAEPADPSAERYAWQAETRSPRPLAAAADELGARCPLTDAALQRVAERVARRELAEAPTLEVAEVTFALRSEGAPYVWPRVWTLRGPGARAEAGARLDAWLAAGNEAGQRRCAVAGAADESSEAVAAVAVGALADLQPLPTSVRIGAWLDFRAGLLVPANEVEVLVLGPRGLPHRVPAVLSGGEARARVHVDREGMFLVQLLANVEGGPRPVAEALVFAGSTPNSRFSALPAPGEAAAVATDEPAQALLSMLNTARNTEGLAPLAADARLTAVAQAHAEAMRRTKRVAHDAGDGSPLDRASALELALGAIAENVAHAGDAAHAHRALWASPSHRSNLLDPRFEAIGIGVASDDDGSIWVCELFAHPR